MNQTRTGCVLSLGLAGCHTSRPTSHNVTHRWLQDMFRHTKVRFQVMSKPGHPAHAGVQRGSGYHAQPKSIWLRSILAASSTKPQWPESILWQLAALHVLQLKQQLAGKQKMIPPCFAGSDLTFQLRCKQQACAAMASTCQCSQE